MTSTSEAVQVLAGQVRELVAEVREIAKEHAVSIERTNQDRAHLARVARKLDTIEKTVSSIEKARYGEEVSKGVWYGAAGAMRSWLPILISLGSLGVAFYAVRGR